MIPPVKLKLPKLRDIPRAAKEVLDILDDRLNRRDKTQQAELTHISQVLTRAASQIKEWKVPRSDGHEFLALLAKNNRKIEKLDKAYPNLGLKQRLQNVAQRLDDADAIIRRSDKIEFKGNGDPIAIGGHEPTVQRAIEEIERALGQMKAFLPAASRSASTTGGNAAARPTPGKPAGSKSGQTKAPRKARAKKQ
jgi:hypothetical protein